MADDTKPKLESYRSLPGTSRTAGVLSGQRGTNRGEAVTVPLGKSRCTLAEEGSYFVATNPTIGTGVAGITAANGWDATEAFMVIRNDNSAASGKYITLDRLSLTTTAAGTSGTNVEFTSHVDGGDRYTSGGAALTAINPNMASSTASGATGYAGAVVAPAAINSRVLDARTLRTVITVVGDRYDFDFGGETLAPAGLATAGTAQCHLMTACAPVVLGPGDSWIFTIFAGSQAAASSFEFSVSWWER